MASRYAALVQAQADAAKALRALLDGAVDPESKAPRPLSADESAKADGFKVQIQTLQAEIDREEALQAVERGLTVPPGNRIAPQDRAQDDPKRGFRDLADFALSVRGACVPGAMRRDPRLEALYQAAPATPFHQEAGTTEGYMVPPAMRDAIWDLIFSDDDLLALVAPEPTSSNAVQLLADETTPWGALGIQAKWRAEASQMTPSKLATSERLIRLHELYAFASATEELLQDAPLLNARLTRGAGRAIQWKASEAVMWGTGAGQPLGWMVAASLLTQTKEAAQPAATVLAKNLTKMYSKLLVGPGSRPTWIASRTIVPELVDLKIGDQPAWTSQNAGLREAPAGLLLGYPVRFSQHCQVLGTKGDVQLVDLAGYYATVRDAGIRFDSSIHLYFDYGLQAFRWTFRLGGQPYLSAVVPDAKGAGTTSHFVTLETRS